MTSNPRFLFRLLAPLAAALFLAFAPSVRAQDNAAAATIQRAPEGAEKTVLAVFVVTVPEGTGTVYLTGWHPELGPWDPMRYPMSGEGRQRFAALPVAPGTPVEFKVTLGSWDREALDAKGQIPGNQTATIGDVDAIIRYDVPAFRDPNAAPDYADAGDVGQVEVMGTLEDLGVFSYEGLLDRRVEVWLPPGYAENPDQRYPVLYMHDGQNLFVPSRSFTRIDWGVDESICRLAEAGEIPWMIVVAISNSDRRMWDYNPWGGADLYGKLIAEKIKPAIDAKYRTMPGREHTGIMGSSMGGLISLALAWKHPDVFGRAGCLSSSFQITDKNDGTGLTLPDAIAAAPTFLPDTRLYFDYGMEGRTHGGRGEAYIDTHERLAKFLDGAGFKRLGTRPGAEPGGDAAVEVEEGDSAYLIFDDGMAPHNEAAWRARLDLPMTMLFGDAADALAEKAEIEAAASAK